MSQSYHLKQELKDQFAESKGELWFTSYLGYEQSKFPVDFVIGQDGETYRAILQYPQSGKKLYYDGDYTSGEVFTLAEYDNTGTLTGHLNLSKKGDHISAIWNVSDVESSIPLLLIPDKIGKRKVPKLNLAAYYRGQFMGKEVECKVYYQKGKILLTISSDKAYNEIGLQSEDLFHQSYKTATTEIVGVSIDNLNVTVTDDKLLLKTLFDDKEKVTELTLIETLPAKSLFISGFKSHLEISLPDHIGKNFNKWLNRLERISSIDKTRILQENRDNDFAFEERYAEWVGLDTKISYFDAHYLSGDVFIYTSKGLAMESFVYDRLKDKFLDIADVISPNAIKKLNAKETEPYSQVKISEDGFLFHGDFDVNFGLQKTKLSFADIASAGQDIIANKAIRKHFLNK